MAEHIAAAAAAVNTADVLDAADAVAAGAAKATWTDATTPAAAHVARAATAAAAAAAYHTYHMAAANDAANAAAAAADAGVPAQLIASDFQRLRTAAEVGKWDDTTPVPPSVFGPLDEGPAPSPAAPIAPKRLVLKAYMRPDADPEKVADKLVELYAALNDYSLEQYGVGLSAEDFEQFLSTGVLDPVGGPP